MKTESTLETIIKIENDLDVNTIIHNDHRIWPLVRLAIYMRLNLIDNKSNNMKLEELFTSIRKKVLNIGKYIFRYYLITKYIKFIHSLDDFPKVEILFFSRNQDYALSHKIAFDKFIDPIIHLVNHKYSFLKYGSKSKFDKIRHQKTIFLSREETIGANIYHANKFQRTRVIPGLDSVLKKYKIITEKSLDHEWIIEYSFQIDVYTSYFTELLKKLRPKVVFLSCYYYPYCMGLIRACKSLKVITVDIQHGHQSKHPMYLYWTKIPLDGYDLLPDYYWVWSNLNRDNILSTRKGDSVCHKPIVGGNQWITYWNDNKDMFADHTSNSSSFFSRLINFKKIILYTCSGFSDINDLIDDHVLNVMIDSPTDWFWLVRLHPHHEDRIDELSNYLTGKGISNFDVKFSTLKSLYEVFDYSSCLVTSGSSAGIEGVFFKLNVIITGTSGYFDFYEDYIKNGDFLYAPNYKTLFEGLKRLD